MHLKNGIIIAELVQNKCDLLNCSSSQLFLIPPLCPPKLPNNHLLIPLVATARMSTNCSPLCSSMLQFELILDPPLTNIQLFFTHYVAKDMQELEPLEPFNFHAPKTGPTGNTIRLFSYHVRSAMAESGGTS